MAENQSKPLGPEDIWKLFRETDRKMQETARQMKETDRQLTRLENLFTGQWGKLMESLVEGELVKLLRHQGIAVDHILRSVEADYGAPDAETDLLAVNGDLVVGVEVKTTLRVKAVKRFLEVLGNYREIYSAYKNHRIHGAVAYLRVEENSHIFAERHGLFVIRATGSSAAIINQQDFKARAF